MECPKCGTERAEGSLECPRCGIVFEKWQEARDFPRFVPRPASALPRAASLEPPPVAAGRLGRQELTILGVGLVTAVLAYTFGFTRLLFSALVTLFHELGHAVVGWLLGHPSLPAFDFVYGGGFTHSGELNLGLALLIAAAFLTAAWWSRRNRRALALVVGVFALWLLVVSSAWRRELMVAAAGHGFELLLSGVFFYRAVAGTGWRMPEIERPLGAFAAFFVQIHALHFALRLRGDPGFLAAYLRGKGGMLMNDLESIALDLTIHLGWNPGVRGVAAGLLAATLLPLPLALLLFRTRDRWQRGLGSLLIPEP